MNDNRTFAQRWSDSITEFSGSWPFIFLFTAICVVWIVLNGYGVVTFDVYPFLFLNWVLTIISTFQNPLIMMSQNRQNDRDRETVARILLELTEIKLQLRQLREKVEFSR
jgi:uncharacterized membrane protein